MNAYSYNPYGGYQPFATAQYSPLAQAPNAPNYQNQQASSNGIIWVQGEAGARAYIVTPGASILLMDSDAPRFYIKSADQSGVPSLRIFEYNEYSQTAAPKSESFATRAEYDALLEKYNELAAKIEQLTASQTKKASVKKSVNAGGDEDE